MRARNERQQSSHYGLCTFSRCASALIPQEALCISSSSLDFIPLDNCPKSVVQKLVEKKHTVFCPLHFISCVFFGSSCKGPNAQLARAIFLPPANQLLLSWSTELTFFSLLFNRNIFQWNTILLNPPKINCDRYPIFPDEVNKSSLP